MKKNNQLTTQSISKLIQQIAIPASVGFFFYTMFNVVDTYFAGLISTEALAALSLSFPVFFIIIAMGSGLSTGTTAVIATALGAGNHKQARLYAIQGIAFGVILAIIITFFGVSVSPFLFSMLGATDDYLLSCLNYMNTIFSGTVFFIIVFMFNSILNAMGDTRSHRNFLIAGFFLNIILNRWLVYGGLGIPALRIVGIGLATNLVQLLGCVYLGFRVSKSGLLSNKPTRHILPKLEPFKEIARQGLPASLNMITVGLGIFVITYFISRFGKQAVAAYGIATRLEQIVLLPTIGLNIATLTIVAQNNGAKLFGRIRETVNTSLRYGGILMTIGTVMVFIFARYLMLFFTNDANVIQIGISYLRIAAFVLYAYVILYVNIAALQGIKQPNYAVWIGFFRQIFAPVITFYMLVEIFDVGLTGIWWGILSITWAAAVITIFYARWKLNKVIRLSLAGDFRMETG
jgi:putative MATE family efflux protein